MYQQIHPKFPTTFGGSTCHLCKEIIQKLGGGFKHFVLSPRNLGKIPIVTNIFQRG